MYKLQREIREITVNDENYTLSSFYLIDLDDINRSASLSAVDTCQYNFLTHSICSVSCLNCLESFLLIFLPL
jgi:hypothetical protein